MRLAARSLSCTRCGSPIEVRNARRAKSVVCPACGSQLDLTTPKFEVLGQLEPGRHGPRSCLALGLRGELDGTRLEIVGRLRLEERDPEEGETWDWDEWLVLTEKGQYLWIQEEEGDFELQRIHTPSQPLAAEVLASVDEGDRVVLDGRAARVAERGHATIVHVEGELTWRARPGDRVSFLDLETGAIDHSIEWTDEEIEYFEEEPVTPRRVWEIFELTELVEQDDRHRVEGEAVERRVGRTVASAAILFVAAVLAGLLFVGESLALQSIGSGSAKGVTADELATGHEIGQVPLGTGLGSYVLAVNATLQPGTDTLDLALVSPAGASHDVLRFERVGPRSGSRSRTVHFRVPTEGTWKLVADGRATSASAGIQVVGTDPGAATVSWRVTRRLFSPGFAAMGGAVLFLLAALVLVVGAFRGGSARARLRAKWRAEREAVFQRIQERAVGVGG